MSLHKPQVILVAAVDQNGAIGKGNTLPWRHRADMAHFKATTTGHVVVMGSKTFESMGSRPLKDRINIVLTRDPSKYAPQPNTFFVQHIEQALGIVDGINTDDDGTRDLYVIGGGQIYEAFVNVADKLILTWLDLRIEGADTWMPNIPGPYPCLNPDGSLWHIDITQHPAGEKHPDDVAYGVWIYTRIKS